jgi:serine/threonine protein kinase
VSSNDDRTIHGQGRLKGIADSATNIPTQPAATASNPHEVALPLAINDVVDERYQITGVVGRGRFGAIYSARHLISGADVAVKVLLARPQGNREEVNERFFREARVLAKLHHPNTVRVYDAGYTASGDLYFAMELLNGPNLEQVFTELGRHRRTLTEAQAIDIALPILGALGEAHHLELVHRDLKPANIVLSRMAEEPFCVKVLDFGIVRTADSDLTTRETELGTPVYMSPEQCASAQIDGRSDLYAVATILFEAVCGYTPYLPGNPIDVMFEHMNAKVPDIRHHSRKKHSPGFVLLIRKALSKERKKRFQSAAEMRKTLEVIRRESWPDVPVTHLDMMLSRGEQGRLSSTFRVVVREDDDQVDLHERKDAGTHAASSSRLPAASGARAHPQGSAGTWMQMQGKRSVPARIPSSQDATSQLVNKELSERAAVRNDSAETRRSAQKGKNRPAEQLPSQTEIVDAIERHMRNKAQKRSERETLLTHHRDDRTDNPSPVEEVGPPSIGNNRKARRPRPVKLGRGTMVGTGFPIPSHLHDVDGE